MTKMEKSKFNVPASLLGRQVDLLDRIIFLSLLLYLFLLIFPHTTTIKEITFWITFICWVILRFKKAEPFIPLTSITVSLFLFIIIAIATSLVGIEPIESLLRLKGELIIPFILFLITLTEYNSLEKIRNLLFALLVAFAIYTLFTIIESTDYGLAYYWNKDIREGYDWFITGYWQRGILVFPLILGMFLLVKNKWLKYFLIAFVVIELLILIAYRSFTVFLAVLSVLLLWVLFVKPKKYRLWMVGFIVLFLFISGFFIQVYKGHPAIDEYRSKLEKIIILPGEFKNESGFSNRIPAWEAAVDVIKDRPIFGYGWGIKKFTRLVQQEKFLEYWKVNKPHVYNFFIIYKNVFFPPHNMFLEIAIQSGLIGVISFIVFIGIYMFHLIKVTVHCGFDMECNFFIIFVGGVLLSFIIISLVGNELGNISGKILFIVLGTGASLIREKVLKHSTHSPAG